MNKGIELRDLISARCALLEQCAETLEEQGLGDLGGTIPTLRRVALDLSIQTIEHLSDLNGNFTSEQQKELRKGIENGLSIKQVSFYMNPTIHHWDMEEIRTRLQNGQDFHIIRCNMCDTIFEDEDAIPQIVDKEDGSITKGCDICETDANLMDIQSPGM